MKTLAQEIFEIDPYIGNQNKLLDIGFEKMSQNISVKTARYCFYYDPDFAADFVTEYRNLQREQLAVGG